MTTPPFNVDAGAIQWRVTWTCQTGHLLVQAVGAPRPAVNSQCPGNDTGYGTQKGALSLQVTADGPWTVRDGGRGPCLPAVVGAPSRG